MTTITLDVPEALAMQLQPVQHRLPEILERGLYGLTDPTISPFEDEQTILQILADQPAPETVLAIRPSTSLQQRMGDLLAREKGSGLSQQETLELERYLWLEHLVRLAKARAYKKLGRAT